MKTRTGQRRQAVNSEDFEEFVRREVIKRVRGVAGAGAKLARYLGVSPVFVSEYMSGARRSAGVFRTLMIMKYFGLSVNEQLSAIEGPVEDRFLDMLSEPDVITVLDCLQRLRRQRTLRATLVQTATAMAAQYGSEPLSGSVVEAGSGRRAGGR